jgi:hypothetical protein
MMAAWILAGITGCASPGLFKFSKNDFPKAGPKHPVSQIVGVWQPAMGTFENRTTRGFSGQILFFDQGNPQPIQVDGDVRIYVFDDQGSPEQQIIPIFEYSFRADAWNALLSKGPLGATYSVFVPYIRQGNHEAKCVLRIRYLPKKGPPVYSDMVNINLEGKKKADQGDTSATEYDSAHNGQSDGGKSAGVAKDIAAGKTEQARNLTETIAVPDEARAARAQRRAAAELTDEERERIVREAQARLKAETGRDVSLVVRDDSTTGRSSVSNSSAREASADVSRNAAMADDWDESRESAEVDEETTSIARRRSAIGEHVLDDERPGQIEDVERLPGGAQENDLGDEEDEDTE